MNEYIENYELFSNSMIYDFKVGSGGIGDCIKFFMFILEICMNSKTRLYYKKNNIFIEKFIKLKYNKMYIENDKIAILRGAKIVTPNMFYSVHNYNSTLPLTDVFYFSDDVKRRFSNVFPCNIGNYISIHLRMGDKHLETETQYVLCKEDLRKFSEDKLYKFIDMNSNKNIFFCCDNNAYKMKLKQKYKNIITTSNCSIGHTSLFNTTEKQVLDAVTEFYILTNSEMIFGASGSGFSLMASKFNNIPYLK